MSKHPGAEMDKKAILVFEFKHPNVNYFTPDDIEDVTMLMKAKYGKSVKVSIGSTDTIDLKSMLNNVGRVSYEEAFGNGYFEGLKKGVESVKELEKGK